MPKVSPCWCFNTTARKFDEYTIMCVSDLATRVYKKKRERDSYIYSIDPITQNTNGKGGSFRPGLWNVPWKALVHACVYSLTANHYIVSKEPHTL